MMCAGIGLPPPISAVDVVEIDAEMISTTFAKTVFTVADCVIVTAFGLLAVHQAGIDPVTVTHFGVDESVTPVMSEPLFFCVELAPYDVAVASACPSVIVPDWTLGS